MEMDMLTPQSSSTPPLLISSHSLGVKGCSCDLSEQLRAVTAERDALIQKNILLQDGMLITMTVH